MDNDHFHRSYLSAPRLADFDGVKAECENFEESEIKNRRIGYRKYETVPVPKSPQYTVPVRGTQK